MVSGESANQLMVNRGNLGNKDLPELSFIIDQERLINEFNVNLV